MKIELSEQQIKQEIDQIEWTIKEINFWLEKLDPLHDKEASYRIADALKILAEVTKQKQKTLNQSKFTDK